MIARIPGQTALAALLLAAALAWLPAPARAQGPDLAGGYAITGTDPDGGAAYHGSAELTRQGAAYLFEAEIGGESFSGLGLHDPETGVLALSFLDGGGPGGLGVTLLRVQGSTLRGQWISRAQPGASPGVEVWTRR
ncbi:hypothetical protein [Desulfocurvus sp.]|jgi:hypothetical protein|uniref:hypothetical protein n=1 Tax=Desulfocurvus sp. TaxID=2871698 RepID=UPI0025C60970|nr:hypothetical protein [Desulfocurvus sp.]MCK9239426.1 hypothetical protein [Desulfocurvus sp.]